MAGPSSRRNSRNGRAPARRPAGSCRAASPNQAASPIPRTRLTKTYQNETGGRAFVIKDRPDMSGLRTFALCFLVSASAFCLAALLQTHPELRNGMAALAGQFDQKLWQPAMARARQFD